MEASFLHRAIDNLYAASGIVGEIDHGVSTDAFDGVLRLLHTAHAIKIPFIVKRQLTAAEVDGLKSLNKKVLIVFDKATDAEKERLRKENLSYLESSGNAFLNCDGFFLFIDTEKGAPGASDKAGKAFSKTGLKIIYSLLSNTDVTETNYRNLADLSGTSIDSVGRVLRELVSDKYLVKTGNRGYKIVDQSRLLNDWAILFNKVLRPSLKARAFDFQDSSTELRSLLGQDTGGLIGGELAAESMDNHLISRKATVYVAGSFVDFALKNQLKPTKNGRITLLEKFWNRSDNYWELSEFLASPTLVYADLLNDPSPRNLEAATLLLNRNLHEPVQ
ncbi:type IV toxin-antitoxin system AbiEi family antitoxin [Neolewinella lacunae]|uniref:Uncharacterized protein n=1 Tax=Neolewinella lacunae TaxID=1517758 RepID=A0A923PMJ7_9BACT|nr:type IV toxin-antitoxin system AbiEi family antitoxin [Neolewinella lacunae]MBC6993948.1 hypothetical protein [Neolewinella lacunae]MDN3634971.1 type IV toxin-antitoxin system AbiEi family antitoxin [Neolewinella lacunae]